jgi:hypothetical protein
MRVWDGRTEGGAEGGTTKRGIKVGVVEGKAHQCQCGPDAGRDVINSSIHTSES